MLNSMRKGTTKWLVQIFLGLIIVSFAFWGVGDIFLQGVGNRPVATVGPYEISANEAAGAFEESLSRLRAQLGTALDRDQALRLGVMNQAIETIVAQRLIALGAAELQLEVSDEYLRQAIVDNPVFHDDGAFNRQRFDALLRSNSLTEEGYLAGLRLDAVRNRLMDGITANIVVPDELIGEIYLFRNELRTGRALLVDADAIDDIAEPTDNELTTYLNDNENRYSAPVYRAITAITLAPDDLIDEIAVEEDRVRAEYDERIEIFTTPEQRTVEQLLASDQAAIDKAAELVAGGANPAAVAGQLAGDGVRFESLGSVTSRDLPDEFASAIFGLDASAISQPVQSAFGWHLFHVTAIEPEAVRPFADVRELLENELALQDAIDSLPSLRNALDDELAAGVSLEEAAATLGLDVRKVEAMDARGLDLDGEPIATIPLWPELLSAAFEAADGETSLLDETGDGAYYVVRVDGITDARPRSLDEVRDEVEAAWRKERQDERASEVAGELLAMTGSANTLDELAQGQPAARLTAITELRRGDSGSEQGLSAAAVRALFDTDAGNIAEDVVPVTGGYAVIETGDIVIADPLNAESDLEAIRLQFANEMRADIIAQYEAALRQRFPVDIDREALSQIF